ncbi:MAG: ABC transporter permease subunit, partial [Caldilinea sp.]|nr:ABC transporter permease subunit [Caldilinea sp.]MDW8442628.1 ABC transporter permease subunit [Caldilineaceae bacterium]
MSSQSLVSSKIMLRKKTAVAKRRRDRSKITATYLLLLPGLVYLFFNNYLPMAGIVMAFKRIDFRLGIFGSPWNGLENFRFLFVSGDAWIITRNTILYNVAFIVLGILVGVTLAILMFELHEQKIARVYQTLLLLPMLMSWVVVSYLGFALLSTETGFINKTILSLLGIDKPIAFYQEPKYWPFILVLANMWKGIGFSMIVYLSSILSINPEYFDAAKVDGASKWQQIRHITLPSLKPVVIILVILSM